MIFDDAARAGYLKTWASAEIRDSRLAAVDAIVDRIRDVKDRYRVVSQATGVPWFFIAITHYRERNLSFKHHLHNGDPLTARTVRVPAGRPAAGNPPFDWDFSAEDALAIKNLHKWNDWSLAGILYQCERFNGFGYRSKGHPSPYLWSYTTAYVKGKYVADHKYDPEAVDQQCGVATILKRMMERKLINLEGTNESDAAPRVDDPGGRDRDDGDADGGVRPGHGGRRPDVLPGRRDQGPGGRGQAPGGEVSLKDQLLAAANKHVGLPRADDGYQGDIEEVLDPVTVIPVRCADGRTRYVEPREKSRCFVRDYVKLGESSGVSVVEFLAAAVKIGLGVLMFVFLFDVPRRDREPRPTIVDLPVCDVDHGGWARCPVEDECER